MLRQACAEASTWPEHFNVAVNISPLAFKSGSLVQAVVGALAASALAPNRLELEITESVILTDTEATLSIMHELQALGVRFVLDDFGTGYSSLGYLRRFPFAKIKIDRVFVADLSRGGKDARAILRAVSSLGNALGMTITAEGVESEEQLETVRAEGCTEMQGFLFSAARSPEEIRHHFFPSQRACARVA